MTLTKAHYNAESAVLEALDWQKFSDDDIQAVIEDLLSGRVNSIIGTEVTAFEPEFAAYCERDYGLAVTNGTAALELAVFSFCQDKIMTTAGEGGMMLCNDQGLYATAYDMRDHGRSAHPAPAVDAGEFVYSRNSNGSNYRMTELQAAVGRRQLLRLEYWVRTRRRCAEILTTAVAGIEHVHPPQLAAEARHAYYRYYLGREDDCLQTGWDRSRLLRELRYRGVPAHTGSCPEIYRERAIIDLGLAPPVALPVTRRVAGHTLALPVHPTQTEPQVVRLTGVLRDTLQNAIYGPGQ